MVERALMTEHNTGDVVCVVRCSVLACRAYVALYHSDYLVALKYAETLLRQPRLSGAHRSVALVSMLLAHLQSVTAATTTTLWCSPVCHSRLYVVSSPTVCHCCDNRDSLVLTGLSLSSLCC